MGDDNTTSTTASVRASATPRAPAVTGEPAAAAALLEHADLTSWAGAGNGSLLLAYEVRGRGCYFRQVMPDATVIGWFGKRGGLCPTLFGFGTGFVGIDGPDPQHRSQDLSVPGAPLAVRSEVAGREPAQGDIYLGPCSDLTDEEDDYAIADDGCAYSPTAHTLYRLHDSLGIDPHGRVWSVTTSNAVRVTDGAEHWDSPPFREQPTVLLAGGEDSAMVWFDFMAAQVTGDAGRSWRRVTGVPPDVQSPVSPAMLSDGRLVLGMTNGQLWRGTDPSNTAFEALEAGPLDTVVAAGERLYGLAEGAQDRRLTEFAWFSDDDGSTWTQAFGPGGASHPAPPVPADQLEPLAPTDVPARIAGMKESGVAVTKDGFVMVTYEGSGGQGDMQTAWRLYDQDDEIVADGEDGWLAAPAGDGFVVSTSNGLRFSDDHGQLRRIRDAGRRPAAAGDVVLPELGVYRPSTAEMFSGAASPDGTVTAVDGRGRAWAVGRTPRGRTVVRWALPGESWSSRDIGPAIGARTVVAKGATLIVAGRRELYVSNDSGETWDRVVHGAGVYSGLPTFSIRPDGTIVAGDSRAGYRISHDGGHIFQKAEPAEAEARVVGGMFARGRPGATEVSIDRKQWKTFTPAVARRLQPSVP